MREFSRLVGLTERQVHRILNDLEAEGYITREREGRQNRYTVQRSRPVGTLAAARDASELLAVLGE